MKIYTITLNPAYDIHAYTEHFEPFCENLAAIGSKEAGGKGVNISRALKSGNIPNAALIVLGTENAADFINELKVNGIDSILFEKEGRIRENLTLHAADADETRISFSGFELDDSILGEISSKLEIDDGTVVTFTGRIPSGISLDAVKAFLSALQNLGARVVLDSRSFTLSDIYDVKPWLIKPNEEEIAEFLGYSIKTVIDAAKAASEISANGVENVMISLGSKGAVLSSDGKIYSAAPPEVSVRSTIGAGDSSIAGFIAATLLGKASAERLKTAVAFGTAACLTEGSRPPLEDDINNVFENITVSEIQKV